MCCCVFDFNCVWPGVLCLLLCSWVTGTVRQTLCFVVWCPSLLQGFALTFCYCCLLFVECEHEMLFVRVASCVCHGHVHVIAVLLLYRLWTLFQKCVLCFWSGLFVAWEFDCAISVRRIMFLDHGVGILWLSFSQQHIA